MYYEIHGTGQPLVMLHGAFMTIETMGALVPALAELIQAIAAPALVVIGDADGTRPEHAVALFRLLGGGVFGDIAGLPRAQLAVLPGTTHVGMLDRVAWLVPMIAAFLDAPMA